MDESDADYHNFSQTPSSTHRLPTVNGAQALLEATEKYGPIPTGLAPLDAVLTSPGGLVAVPGGILRGCVTELYGPPGSGKTSLAMQLVANAINQDEKNHVIWIDTSTELIWTRLNSITKLKDEIQQFHHHFISSLAHLLAFFTQHSTDSWFEDTALLVIDDLSTLITTSLPQSDNINSGGNTREDILSRSLASRRSSMLSAISSKLAHCAAAHNMAIVVVNKSSSNRKAGSKCAVLRSTLSAQQWTENISSRIVIYRDFWPEGNQLSRSRDAARQSKRKHWALRIAEVERLAGKEVSVLGVGFVILQDGLQAVDQAGEVAVPQAQPQSPSLLPSEDNEEAMGNLGLEDAHEVDDLGMRMPEDVPINESARRNQMKRNIDEVADSDEDGEVELPLSEPQLPPMPSKQRGFLRSSQLTQVGANDDDDMLLRH